MPYSRILAFFLLTVAWPCMLAAQDRIPGQFIVQLNENTSVENFLKSIYPKKAEIQQLSSTWNVWRMEFRNTDDQKLLADIRKSPQVRLAQFNHRVQKRSITLNDTLFDQQWNLNNTGQAGGTPNADVNAPAAWELGAGGTTALGDTIVIAVVDEGFYLPHEDLRFWKNRHDPRNGIDDDLNGYIDDYNGWNVSSKTDSISSDSHGTHVAGVAAATGNNLVGTAGVAYQARLLPVSIPNYEEAQVVQAYSYIFDMRKLYNETQGQKGAFIVAANSSFGWDFGKPNEFPLWCALYDSLGSVGVISIASTMNITTDVDVAGDIPSTCPGNHLIIVTNTNRFDRKNTSAAFGYQSVDLGAPGTAIQSTIPFNNYGFQSGTSMSAAHVAGAVAVIYSAACSSFIQSSRSNPSGYALTVKDYILSGTDILPDLDGLTVSGGRLDVYNSVHSFINDSCVSCLTVTELVTDISCHGNEDGHITLTSSQGMPPYFYEWSTGASGNSIAALPRGKYSVKVSDSNGCERYRYYEITQPFPLTVNLVADSAVNGENGSVSSFIKGGTEPYLYEWSDSSNSTSSDIQNLPPGEYSVTVTDAHGCQAVKSAEVGNIVGISIINDPYRNVTIYPNPLEASGWVKLEGTIVPPCHLQIYDISGKAIAVSNCSGRIIPIDLSAWPAGMYLVKIISEEYSIVRKITKE